MSTIRIEDVAFVRFSAPDLDAMAAFLTDFGLVPFRGDDGVLYARGRGPAPRRRFRSRPSSSASRWAVMSVLVPNQETP